MFSRSTAQQHQCRTSSSSVASLPPLQRPFVTAQMSGVSAQPILETTCELRRDAAGVERRRRLDEKDLALFASDRIVPDAARNIQQIALLELSDVVLEFDPQCAFDD